MAQKKQTMRKISVGSAVLVLGLEKLVAWLFSIPGRIVLFLPFILIALYLLYFNVVQPLQADVTLSPQTQLEIPQSKNDVVATIIEQQKNRVAASRRQVKADDKFQYYDPPLVLDQFQL